MATPTPAAKRGQRVRSSLDQILANGLAKWLERVGLDSRRDGSQESLMDLASAMLSLRGRASGPALASAFFDRYEGSDRATRQAFLGELHDHFPRDVEAIEHAIAQWTTNRDEASAARLADAAESPSARLIHMLNLAPGGTRRLIGLRADLLADKPMTPGMKALDRELADAFTAWFNAGFLELRRIEWTSPASVLERLIRYEAVHEIRGWGDLRHRVEPLDRRCYGFFHPQMHDDPLIFVEVALTREIPSAIHEVIAEDRQHLPPHQAQCAIFYSISSCQEGLRGIPFGNFLIKQVVDLLKQELPQLKRFATLSPVPGFAEWLHAERDGAPPPQGDALRAACARYIATARDRRGQVADPVGRFHLGNGARLEAVHAGADLSDRGQRQSHGVMVNYLYDLDQIEANHVRLFELDTVSTSPAVADLLKPAKLASRGTAVLRKLRKAEVAVG